jgi:hypothetical protein
MAKKMVKAECPDCGGTGLYRGFAEPEGVAVVCLKCGGTGCIELRYTPFIKRNGERGIHTVRLSRGSFIGTGVGPAGPSITYEEFKNGKMPG